MNSIEIKGINIQVLGISLNEKQLCPTDCYYRNKKCKTKRDLSICQTEEELTYTKIIINVKNKSNATWSSEKGAFELIDNDGFAYRLCDICTEFKPTREYDVGSWNLSPKTQVNYFLIFPEFEQGKFIVKLIYAPTKADVEEITIAEYPSSTEDLFMYKEVVEPSELSPKVQFYEKYGLPTIRCNDGHFVRSKQEAQVDDFLLSRNIIHIYECHLPSQIFTLCDWYLPVQNVFIEYWGMEDDDEYVLRMNEKIKIYEDNNFNLISIFENDLANLEYIFDEQINRLGVDKNISKVIDQKDLDGILPSFVSIDFETANSERNSACSLGVVIVDNNKIVAKKEYLIQPPTQKFTFTGYHGLTWNDVKDSPTFPEVWEEIKHIFTINNKIVAHNASFDKSILKSLLAHYTIDAPDFDFFCTLKESKKYIKADDYGLDTLCKKLGISLTHHEALSDANAAAEIMIYINSMQAGKETDS